MENDPLVWENLRPKLEDLLQRNRQHIHEETVKWRRRKIRQLIKKGINSLRLSQDSTCSTAECAKRRRCRAAYVPVLDVDELKCSAIDDFVKANEENDDYDETETIPDDTLDTLLAEGLAVELDARRHFMEDTLKKLLVEGVTRVDNDFLASLGDESHTSRLPLPPLQLPSPSRYTTLLHFSKSTTHIIRLDTGSVGFPIQMS